MLEAFVAAFGLVFVAEFGDKTRRAPATRISARVVRLVGAAEFAVFGVVLIIDGLTGG